MGGTTYEPLEVSQLDDIEIDDDASVLPRPTLPRLTSLGLLRSSRSFRLFFLSYTAGQFGNWFSFLASIQLLQELSSSQHPSSSAVAVLLVLRTVPPTLFSSSVAGPLVDRTSNKGLLLQRVDLACSSLCLLLPPLALATRSVAVVYVLTASLSILGTLHEVTRAAILMKVLSPGGSQAGDDVVRTASNLLLNAWSLTAAVSAYLGGLSVARLGVLPCYYLNGLSYLISAFVLFLMQRELAAGERRATQSPEYDSLGLSSAFDDEDDNDDVEDKDDAELDDYVPGKSPPESGGAPTPTHNHKPVPSSLTLWGYFSDPPPASVPPLPFPFLLLKFSGSAMWGAADVLNVVFSAGDSAALGCIYGSVGVGCVLGPLFVDALLRLRERINPPRPSRMSSSDSPLRYSPVLDVCLAVLGLFFVALGAVCLRSPLSSPPSSSSSSSSPLSPSSLSSFLSRTLLPTCLRAAGSAIMWSHACVLVQLLAPPGIIGRVAGVENGLFAVGEAGSAMAAGAFVDRWVDNWRRKNDGGDVTERMEEWQKMEAGTTLSFWVGVIGFVALVFPWSVYAFRYSKRNI